jgi:hypothetical protein
MELSVQLHASAAFLFPSKAPPEYRLRIFENRVLRKIFGPKREEDIVEKIA